MMLISKTKKVFSILSKRLAFLIVVALIEFSEYFVLFIFPIIVFEQLRTFWLAAAMLVILPIAKGLSYLVIIKIIKRTDTRFLYLFGFTWIFAMIIILNRQFTIHMLPVLLLFWGVGLESVRMSLSVIKKRYFVEFVGPWEFLIKPVQVFAIMIAPVFAATIYLGSGGYTDIFNFLGFILAVSALLFFFRLNKIDVLSNKPELQGYGQLPSLSKINKSIFFVTFITMILWLQLPLLVLTNSHIQLIWQYLLSLYILPYFVLALLKNVFKLRIWQLHSHIKYIMLGVLLLPAVLASNVMVFALLLVFLGFVNALILMADQHEKLYQELNADFVLSIIAGYLLATLFILSFGNFWTIQNQLSFFGLGIALFGLISFFWKRFKHK